MDPSAFQALMATAIAALFGVMVKLQNDRITDRDKAITKLEAEKLDLAGELKATALKLTEGIKAEQESTRLELAELRKTHAAMIDALSAKGMSS